MFQGQDGLIAAKTTRPAELNTVTVWYFIQRASQVVLVVKRPDAHAVDTRDMGWIPGFRRPLGGGHGIPLLP